MTDFGDEPTDDEPGAVPAGWEETDYDRAMAAGDEARDQLVDTIRAALAVCDQWLGHGLNLPDLLADAAATVVLAANDVDVLTRHRPDSREADAVRQLVAGTQSIIDDRLTANAAAAGHMLSFRQPIIGARRAACSCGRTWPNANTGGWRSHARDPDSNERQDPCQ